MARILVVDDEPAIAAGVAAYLAREGHTVEVAHDAGDALRRARSGQDLMLLDVMLPGASGFDILRTLRGEGVRVPVIMVTARVDLVDRVAGLEIGADDYVTKPFEPRELVARVAAVLRRTGPATNAASAPPPLRLLDLEIDLARREVRRDGTEIVLTRTEFDLLAVLAAAPGWVFTREQLGSRLFGELFEESDRTVDSHVRNLRRKLADGAEGAEYVETVRGVGYRTVAPR